MRVERTFSPVENSSHNSSGGIRLPFVTIIAIITLIVGFFIGYNKQELLPNLNLPGELNYSELDEIYSVLKQNFHGNLDSKALLEGASRGFVAGVGDDYTRYFTYAESNEFFDDLEGSFEGIGAELGNKNGKLTVMSTVDGSPAKKSGLLPGDIISKVDGTTTIDWQPEPAVKIIRGDKGTSVTLTIIRGDETKDYIIVRDKVTDPSVKWEIIDNVGYMRISRFGESDTTILARKVAEEFVKNKVDGVILDLRGNTGGYVDAAQNIAGLWLKSGSVIVIEKRGERIAETLKATGNNILEGKPTIVLIDGSSASASEIVAGALQDHNVAKLVGTKSFGKGSVQAMIELRSGAQLKVTVAKWYTPNEKNIDGEGIKPDYEIKFDSVKYDQGIDVQKDKAIELLKK